MPGCRACGREKLCLIPMTRIDVGCMDTHDSRQGRCSRRDETLVNWSPSHCGPGKGYAFAADLHVFPSR